VNGPLRQLTQRRLLTSTSDEQDRRIKRLRLTASGQALEKTLSGDQRDLFARVFARVGPRKEQAWREVMQMLESDVPDRTSPGL
jgi:DNA-binding MarR family transcriptional regulator